MVGPIDARVAPHVIAGRYVLRECVGVGGMSQVFRATDHATGRSVAVKAPTSWGASPSIRLEIAALGRIRHDNVVQMLDHGQLPDGRPFLVMRMIEGSTLSAWLTPRGTVTELEALSLSIAIGSALEAIHAQGFVHLDLKPQNVMVSCRDGIPHPVLIDFGISSSMKPGAGRLLAGAGTIRYSAPEQLRGCCVDERADVYALGVLMYRMLTGGVPFPGRSWTEVLRSMMSSPDPVDSKADVSHEMSAVVHGCLAIEPRNRWRSMSELVDVLRGCYDAARHRALERVLAGVKDIRELGGGTWECERGRDRRLASVA